MPDGFYGVAAPELSVLARDADPRLATHAAGIRAAELDFVRSTVDWRQVEPVLGAEGVHLYDWSATDRLVRALARQGLGLVPSIVGTPAWAKALGAFSCGPVAAISEAHAPAYGDLAGALVRRYGREGAFWTANPDLAPQPIRRVEIWNEPNWTGFWCPGPQPEGFAAAAFEAARSVRAADPAVRTTLGGLVVAKQDSFFADGRIQGMATDTFLRRMVAAQPQLPELLDEVAVHLYHQDPATNVSLLAWTRRAMEDAGLGGAAIFVSEFGWHTQGSALALDEAARTRAYADFVSLLSRTDCDVRGIAPHDWYTAEADPANPEDWFGIADPTTAALRPAGESYRDAVALFEGRGPAPAPRETIRACGGPLPDQDGDGTPDEGDDYPLDATRATGSGEVPQAGPALQPPPAPTFATKPAAWSKSTSPSFSYAAPGASYFECRLDAGQWQPCGGSRTLSDLAEGPHRFSVRAVDSIELVGPAATHEWTVDTRPPETTITSGPAGVIEGDAATFELASDEPDPRFICRLDGGAWEWCGAKVDYVALDVGSHSFEAVAVDRADNGDPTYATRTFEVRIAPGETATPDTRAPETTIDAGPSGTTANDPVEFSLGADEPDAGFRCRLDGGAWNSCGRTATYAGLADGAHVFEAVAIDGVGNEDPTPARREFRVDRTAPDLTLQPPASTRDLTPTLRFTATDPSGPVRTACRVDSKSWADCDSPWTTTKLKVGSHTLSVRATDALGNAVVKSYAARFLKRRLKRRR